MSDLQNPFRFSMHNTTHDVGELLGKDRVVTDIEIKPQEGNIYVHWEFSPLVDELNDLLKKWQRAECFARDKGHIEEADGIGSCGVDLGDLLREKN